MKNIKYKILLVLLVSFCISVNGQNSEMDKGKGSNYVIYTPLDQAIETDSGIEVEAYVDISCFGNSSDWGTYFILPEIVDGGYINVSPPNGLLAPGESVLLTFRFQQSVSSTTSFLYEFRAQWYDETNELFTEFITIDVTYLEAAPSCTLPYPENRTSSNVTNNSALLDWGSVSGSNGYLAEYKLASSSTWDNSVSTSSSQTTITGLSPNSAYNWRVRTKCSNGEYGPVSPTESFTTLADCNLVAPTGLNTTNITDISADISWNPVSSSIGYQVELKQLPSGSYNVVYSGTNTSHTLTNLAFETGYRWRVRARCANGSYSQNWSTAVQFTTMPECPEHLDKTQDVTSGQNDIDDSEITLHATNTIFSGGSAAYDTGTTLSLKPGFHAISGSTFRAFIDGCTPTDPLTEEKLTVVDEENTTIEEVKSVKIFPNPSHGRFNLETNEDISHWELVNQYGNLHRSGIVNTNDAQRAEIDISSFPTGIYFLKVTFKDGTMIRKTVLKD